MTLAGSEIVVLLGRGHRHEPARVSTNTIADLMEEIAAFGGKADSHDLAETTPMEIDELFPVAETLQLPRLAEVEAGDIRLTGDGKAFAETGADQRKHLFGRTLAADTPLAQRIRRALDERANHRAPKLRFQNELEDHMSEEAAEETMRAAINRARYGEVFA